MKKNEISPFATMDEPRGIMLSDLSQSEKGKQVGLTGLTPATREGPYWPKPMNTTFFLPKSLDTGLLWDQNWPNQ